MTRTAAGTRVRARMKPREKFTRAVQPSSTARYSTATNFSTFQPCSVPSPVRSLQPHRTTHSCSLWAPSDTSRDEPGQLPVCVMRQSQACGVHGDGRQHHGLGLGHGEVLHSHLLEACRQGVERRSGQVADDQRRQHRQDAGAGRLTGSRLY